MPTRTELVIALLGLAAVLAAPGRARAEESKQGAEAPRLTIKWSTSSEVDNYGFYVMRSDSEKGPFKELNARVIPGAGNSDLPQRYSYDDTAVELGKTYYYYLDAVSTKGVREKYSPIMAKQCCDQPGQKAPEAQQVDPDQAKPAESSPSPTASPEP